MCSLVRVCSPILWLWYVIGLKLTFFLSSLTDLESLSDSCFAYKGTDTTAASFNRTEGLFLSLLLLVCWKLLGVLSLPTLSFPSGGEVEAASPLARLCMRGKEAGFLTPCFLWASHVL